MKTIKYLSLVLIMCGMLVACGNADKTADRLADSSSLGDRADSASSSDSLPNDRNETNLSKVDGNVADFMDSAALGSKMEIDLGKMAMQKAINAKVKEFAAKMVADHTMISSDLIKIAQKSGVLLPSEYTPEFKAHMEAMKQLKGADFDKHYMEMMVNDHVKTLGLFKSAASLRDNKLQDFASKTLPVLEEHHKLATEIHTGLK